MSRYHVWCLSWDDEEDYGSDIVSYDPIVSGWKSDTRSTIWVAFDALDAKKAAEHYAGFCHSQRDGWEASWPLTFRVRLPDGTTEDYEVDRETVPEFTATKVKLKV